MENLYKNIHLKTYFKDRNRPVEYKTWNQAKPISNDAISFLVLNNEKTIKNKTWLTNMLSYIALKAKSSEVIKVWVWLIQDTLEGYPDNLLIVKWFENRYKNNIWEMIWKVFSAKQINNPKIEYIETALLRVKACLYLNHNNWTLWNISNDDCQNLFTWAMLPFKDNIKSQWLRYYIADTIAALQNWTAYQDLPSETVHAKLIQLW